MQTVAKSISQTGAIRAATILAARTGLTYDVVYLAPRRFGVIIQTGTPGAAKNNLKFRPQAAKFTERDFYSLAGKSNKRKVH